jgi:hypothetical protein
MVHRFAAALLLCVSLAACKENDTTPIGQQLFKGVGDVRVLDAHIVPSGDSSATTSGGTLSWVVARVELTNDFGFDATPQISNFYLIDAKNSRYQAKDSGSSVFTGISNSTMPLKKDEKREYTIGFRTTDPNVTGTIFYER